MHRPSRALPALLAAGLLAPGLLTPPALARTDGPPRRPAPFRIEVVDSQTGRGVPLVELRTVNEIRYVTDSNGIVAFDEPGLLDTRVFFTVISHGYEADKDTFGYRGVALPITEGGTARITIKRLNIAERLYRVTGAGIYRDSVLTGDPAPIREPLLNGRVMGQDSVVNAVYQGKIHWFWGDTNRPDYPLGNFHVPGATSELLDRGGLDPARGVNLTYFLDDKGFARPTAPLPGDGPTWISGLVVLKDRDGRERLFANYAKIKGALEVYQRGLVEFHPQTHRFEKVAQFPADRTYPGDFPSGHTFLHRDAGADYVYYTSPYPLIRVPADPDQLGNPASYQAFTCLKPGSVRARPQLDRGPDGVLRYGWKHNTQVLPQEPQDALMAAGRIRSGEALLNLRDVETGKTVLAHGGSVYWNAYRGRWVMIAVEQRGSTSFLGEVWYALADSPLGPWVYARKVVTHDRYSFYNPKQHPMFDQDGGRVIYFEGTYATTFSGNPAPTPRYEYNQVMYRLDLSDPRLALPVAIYEVPEADARPRLAPRRGGARPDNQPPERVAFLAPDRPGIATEPVYSTFDAARGQRLWSGPGPISGESGSSAPLFYVLADDRPARGELTVRLYEYLDEKTGLRSYSTDTPGTRGRPARAARVIGRVWPNPASMLRW